MYVVCIKHACISKCMSSRLQKLCLHAKTINKVWLRHSTQQNSWDALLGNNS